MGQFFSRLRINQLVDQIVTFTCGFFGAGERIGLTGHVPFVVREGVGDNCAEEDEHRNETGARQRASLHSADSSNFKELAMLTMLTDVVHWRLPFVDYPPNPRAQCA